MEIGMDITLEGTWDDIRHCEPEMKKAKWLTVIIHEEEPEDEGKDYGAPESVCPRDEAELRERLLEAYNGPSRPLTKEVWDDLRNRVRNHGVER